MATRNGHKWIVCCKDVSVQPTPTRAMPWAVMSSTWNPIHGGGVGAVSPRITSVRVNLKSLSIFKYNKLKEVIKFIVSDSRTLPYPKIGYHYPKVGQRVSENRTVTIRK